MLKKLVFLQFPLVYISDGKLLWFLAFEVLEVEFDVAHLLVYIAVRDYHLGALDETTLVVDAEEEDRDARFLCDEVKTLLPVGVERASAFRSDAESEVLALLRLGSEVVGHAGVLAAPYGNAPHLAEDRSQGPEEPFLLHEEVALHALGVSVELTEEEVPVAGVWCEADDELLRDVDVDLFLPSESLV